MHHSKAVGLTETKSAASRRASRRTTFGSQPLWNGQRSFRHARSNLEYLSNHSLTAASPRRSRLARSAARSARA